MPRISKDKAKRRTVPLVMIEGNMEILLNNTVYVSGISLRMIDHPELDGKAVVLIVKGVNQEQADELGFQTTVDE